MKKLLLIAALLSLITSVLAQEQKQGPNIKEMVGGKDYEIIKIGDTVWRFEKEGQFQGYGTPVDKNLLLTKLNNRTRTAGTCFVISRVLTIGGKPWKFIT